MSKIVEREVAFTMIFMQLTTQLINYHVLICIIICCKPKGNIIILLSPLESMPGLHIVVRIAEHACDDASKRILKLSTHRLQIFLVRAQYLRSLLPHRDQAIAAQL